MRLIDYIKGTRRGREANAIEREALADPFLADAIEGYEAVYGSHSDVLAELEEKIAKRAARKRRARPAAPSSGKATAPQPKKNVAAGGTHVSGAEGTPVSATGPQGVPVSKTEDPLVPAATGSHGVPVSTRGLQKGAPVSGAGLQDRHRKRGAEKERATQGRYKIWLAWSAAAVLLVGSAGLMWYLRPGSSVVDPACGVAMDMNDVRRPDINVASDPAAHEPVAVDEAGNGTSFADTPERELTAADMGEGGSSIATERVPSTQSKRPSPETSVQPDTALRPDGAMPKRHVAADADTNTDAQVQPEKQSVVTVITDTFEMIKIDTAIDPAQESTDYVFFEIDDEFSLIEHDAGTQGADDSSIRGAGEGRTSGINNALQQAPGGSEANMAKVNETVVPNNSKDLHAVQPHRIDTVINEEFMRHFRERSKFLINSDGERTEGSVTVEFRVNDRGIPSAIQIVSGFSVETNHEIVDLLIDGPRWKPTHGRRVRMVINYE